MVILFPHYRATLIRDKVGTSPGPDLLGDFDAENLPAFRQRAETVERKFIDAIAKSGVALEAYKDIEDFLQKNEV
jgi:hypothetical protein